MKVLTTSLPGLELVALDARHAETDRDTRT